MRSRYSRALKDVKLLKAGEKYKKLPNYISIWILSYDPFGQNRMLYTVKNFVVEEKTVAMLNDLNASKEQIVEQLMENILLRKKRQDHF